MSTILTFQQLKDAASDLPAPERIELAQFLVHTLDERSAAEVRAEWLALAEQRLAELKTGKVVGIPAADVLAKLLVTQQ
jgi:putative addiction module component (TIGR02574 family)